jgi:hypothetical protein
VHWIGVVVGLLYGQFFSDRIPLWLAARNNGVWKPEFRLHALWLTNFILMPIGLGLVGAALQHKLHWIVFAIGQFFVTIGSLVSIPVTVNYICEVSYFPRPQLPAANKPQVLPKSYRPSYDSRQLHASFLGPFD